MAKHELRFHSAMPGWVKITGLQIKSVPDCEGGGFALRLSQGEALAVVDALNGDTDRTERLTRALTWYAMAGGIASIEAAARGEVDFEIASEVLSADCGERARAAIESQLGIAGE